MHTLTEIRNATRDAECVCIDYFDTLVTRTVAPEDVKRIVSARLARALNIGSSGQNLYRWRAEIEADLCRRNQSQGLDPEFNVLECYRTLRLRIPEHQRPNEEFFTQLCLELEISAECAAQRLDTAFKTLLEELQASGKTCCLISDFYIPSAEFLRMLRHHGVEHLVSRTFVSADTLLTKRSGRLYAQVLSALGLAPGQVLMIGDNQLSDYERPLERHMRAIHLDRSTQHTLYAQWQKESGNLPRLETSIATLLDDRRERHLFPELALTLYAFTERLYERLLGEGVKDVFFMSREGQPLKRLFDVYQSWRRPSPALEIRSHYLEVSRRATFLPSLADIDHEDFHTLFRQYREISAKEFLLSLGLEDLLDDLARELPCDLSERDESFPSSEVFQELKRNARFRDAYADERGMRQRAFFGYLDTFERRANQNTLRTVDVGWKGTIQDNIANLVRQDTSGKLSTVYGYYLGMTESGAAANDNRKSGILFDLAGTTTPHARTFNENRALFEVLLAADHGSVARYGFDSTGRPYAEYDTFVERGLYDDFVRPVQRDLESSFETLCEMLQSRHYPSEWLLRYAAKNHARMVFGASPREIQWFSSVYHIENFGVFEESRFGSHDASHRTVDQLRFVAKFLRHRGRLNLGFWPWLTIARQGGSIAALAYRTLRLMTN